MTKNYLPKHHAILYSSIVKQIIAKFGEAAKDDIKEITKAYGRDRAQRMAKRAVFDGHELNALSYLSYGELDVPKEIIERTTKLDTKNAVQITTKCPWYDAWAEFGHLDYGKYFCEVFDEALAKGFSSSVNMKVPVTITEGDSHCEFVFENSNFNEKDRITLAQRNEKLGKKATKPFLYHMGHLFTFISRELENIYGESGKEIVNNALREYSEIFGEETVSNIINMVLIDYTSIDDYISE